MADAKAPVEDPMRISKFAEAQSEIERKKDAEKAFKSREEYGGFRVPKGTEDEQARYREALDAQRVAARAEPIESLQKRYGNIDPYTAQLFKQYHSAQSTDLKDKYADLIRREVAGRQSALDPDIVSVGEATRMGQAIAQTEPVKTYVDAASAKADQIKRLTK